MKFNFKNIFWIMGTNTQGDSKFTPVRFSEDFNSVWFLKDAKVSECCVLDNTLSCKEYENIIKKCEQFGATEFFAPINSNLQQNTLLFHSKHLYLQALKHGTFKHLPQEVLTFVNSDNKTLNKEEFDKFLNCERLSRRQILTYKKAFKKATKYIEILPIKTENEEFNK